MKTYAIIGGNGVFGIHTAFYLLANADPKKVICIGRNPEKPEPFTLNLGKGDDRYSYHQIHMVFEHDRMMELLDAEKPDIIINYAAIAEPALSFKRSARYYDSNVTAVARLCEDLMARDYLERFIQIGTSELYGSTDRASREDDPLKPTTPYAVSKAAADMHLDSLFNVLKFPMNIVRPSNAYAPGQLLYRIIPKTVVFGLTGRKLPLQGGGKARKSYLHARDLAHALHLVIEKAPFGTTYNVGPPEPTSIRDLVIKTAQAMDKTLEDVAEEAPDRLGQDSQYWLDSSAIARDTGWKMEIGLDEGLAEMVAWGRTYLDFLKDYTADYDWRA
jgi:dTDP-glucose 4,6-dehydratase